MLKAKCYKSSESPVASSWISLSFSCAGQKVRAGQGREGVELPGRGFLKGETFPTSSPGSACRKANVLHPIEATSQGQTAAEHQHHPSTHQGHSQFPRGAAGMAVVGCPCCSSSREVGGQVCLLQAPLPRVPLAPAPLPFPSSLPSCVSHFLAFCAAWEPSRIFSAVAQPTSKGRDE